MFEPLKQEIIKAGMMLDRYGLVALTGGNVSARTGTGEVLVTPSGMMYEDLTPDDIVVMDLNGKIIEGERKPSSDTEAILYIMRNRPDVNGVIHTHQPYATAVGLVEDVFEVNLTELANAAGGPVKVAPYSSAGSIDMGIDTVNYSGDSHAVILAHHGVMTIGSTIKQALYAAVYLEEAAKCHLAAKPNGINKFMTPEQIRSMVEVFRYYGQGTPVIPRELVDKDPTVY